MNLFQKFYDEHENVHVRFVGFSSNEKRYDFGFVYTNLFFGKPLVICMQTGKSTLLDPKDIEDLNHLQKTFRIEEMAEVADLAEFFRETIPNIPFNAQYE